MIDSEWQRCTLPAARTLALFVAACLLEVVVPLLLNITRGPADVVKLQHSLITAPNSRSCLATPGSACFF
jgi:hypothetical protein